MVALHILQAAIVYVNTLMVQEVLGLPEWRACSPSMTGGGSRHCSGATSFRMERSG